ncbi:MAG TPA: helix-turn-helix domain-containing protein [Polyangiaceae bacterium]
MDEATRLFAERGYEGTSMADLAERVGLRKASLFHHFASKEQLRRAVLERLVTRVTRAMATATTTDGGGADEFGKRLDALTDAVVGMLGEQPYAARLVLREAMEWGAGTNDALSEAFAESMRAGEKFLSHAQQSGACCEGDPKHLVASLMGLHLLPFALGGTMERFTGHAPWSDAFLATRRTAVRAQVRSLLLKK